MRYALTLAALAIMLSLQVVPADDAWARGRHGGGHHHYRHGHHHGGHALAIAGAVLGGLALIHILSTPSYAAPPPPAYPPYPPRLDLGGCQPTSGTGYHYGRPAEFLGTICYDRAGRGYILNDSVRFQRYLP